MEFFLSLNMRLASFSKELQCFAYNTLTEKDLILCFLILIKE